MSEPVIRLAGVVRQSIVDGPGLRMTVFVQGCPLHCAGCQNPQTQNPDGGSDCEVSKLLAVLDANPLLHGVTFSGGEPFFRAEQLLPLAEGVRARGKSIWCYSGYTLEELLEQARERPAVGQLLALCDVLVDGRFDETQKSLTLLFRGSHNQRLLDVPRSLQSGTAVLWENEAW